MDRARVERLAEQGNTRKLVKCLGHRDEYVRSAAARGLERIGDPAAAPHLVRSMQTDSDFFVCKCAASALGKCRDAAALTALIQIAAPKNKGGSSNVEVRAAALRSLGHYDDPAAVAALTAATKENIVATSRAAKEALAPAIVGESHYQATLKRIAESGPRNITGRRVTALLSAEPTNPHDPNAVVVTVDGQTIGYLDRDKAAEYSALLQSSGPIQCPVDIRGQKSFGAFLTGPISTSAGTTEQ